MASRILNRRKLQAEAEQKIQTGTGAPATSPARLAPAIKPTRTGARKAAPKKAPPRLRACWVIYDGSMRRVAVFDYNQHPAAATALADLLGKKKGLYFLQILKEPIPDGPAAFPALA